MTAATKERRVVTTPAPQTNETEASATSEHWKSYKCDGNTAARDALVEYYMPLVRRIAKRAARLVPHAVDVDDMISAGFLGLLDAMDAFQLDRGVRFSTFCSYRIRGAILDELRAMDWVPRAVRHHARQVEQATSRLHNKLLRRPTDDELSGELGIGGRKFRKMRRDAQGVDVLSIDSHNPNSRDASGSWSETLRDPRHESPLADALKSELKEIVCRSLNKSEKLIVVLYYYEGMTMKEIGQTLNLSESRVSQVHASILARLRERMAMSKGQAPDASQGGLSDYPELTRAA